MCSCINSTLTVILIILNIIQLTYIALNNKEISDFIINSIKNAVNNI